MERVIKSLEQRPDVVSEVAELLFGDGAWEISKALTENQQRRQAQVGLASNAVGLAAGIAGTKAAYGAYRGIGKTPGSSLVVRSKGAKGLLTSLKGTVLKHPKATAGAALGLQVANLAGDSVANRVLARNAKVKKSQRDLVRKSHLQPISKDAVKRVKSEATDSGMPTAKGKLTEVAVNTGFKAARKAPAVARHAKNTAKMVKGQKLTQDLGDGSLKEAYLKQIHKSADEDEMDLTWRGEISKVDDDKHQVFGWASIIELNGKPVVDLQGDYMDLDTIEKAAYDYVINSRKGGLQHERDGDAPRHVSDLVESFVVTKEKKEQMGLPDDVPVGWWVGFKVNDDEAWADVKSGKRKEFSIHGSGVRKSVELED